MTGRYIRGVSELIIQTQPMDDDPLWIATPDHRAVPHRFWALVDDPQLDYVVRIQIYATKEGAEAHQVVVMRREDKWPFGPAITTVGLRTINLKTYVRAAVEHASRKRTDLENGQFKVEGDDRIHGGPKLGQKGKQTSDARLEAVAEAYREAKENKTSTRRAVMEVAGVGTAQAAKLIRAARDAGKLEPRKRPQPSASPAGPDSGTPRPHARDVSVSAEWIDEQLRQAAASTENTSEDENSASGDADAVDE